MLGRSGLAHRAKGPTKPIRPIRGEPPQPEHGTAALFARQRNPPGGANTAEAPIVVSQVPSRGCCAGPFGVPGPRASASGNTAPTVLCGGSPWGLCRGWDRCGVKWPGAQLTCLGVTVHPHWCLSGVRSPGGRLRCRANTAELGGTPTPRCLAPVVGTRPGWVRLGRPFRPGRRSPRRPSPPRTGVAGLLPRCSPASRWLSGLCLPWWAARGGPRLSLFADLGFWSGSGSGSVWVCFLLVLLFPLVAAWRRGWRCPAPPSRCALPVSLWGRAGASRDREGHTPAGTSSGRSAAVLLWGLSGRTQWRRGAPLCPGVRHAATSLSCATYGPPSGPGVSPPERRPSTSRRSSV